ncbi:hypothetical protein DINM_005384 [Dirofilaria immitis]|nr:hypothetical protein [Dirofilaria immitis]
MPKYTEYYDGEIFNMIDSTNLEYNTIMGLGSVVYWKSLFRDMFMPRGYPQSVSVDYLNYQIWDTIQAFASSMNSALATEAVLRGAGVGNKAASAMAAAISWLLKDGIGLIARIFFAWLYSPYLDADCKQWRLIADCFNDLAFCLDLIAPIFPKLFTLIVCLSSMVRAVVSVAGGATRTTIINHQAISDNAGDVAAKDGSQETVINIFALFVAYYYFLLLAEMNYMKTRKTGTVSEVNNEESIILHWISLRRYYGCRLSEVLSSSNELSFMCSKFIAIYDLKTNYGYVSMANISDTADQLRGALCLELMLNMKAPPSPAELDEFIEQLKIKGWLTSKHRLVFDRWTYSEK